jgi:hypothetical protein
VDRDRPMACYIARCKTQNGGIRNEVASRPQALDLSDGGWLGNTLGSATLHKSIIVTLPMKPLPGDCGLERRRKL